ncbi:MAG: 50S ribosomal protein L9 [Fimbriimonadaceae bacterium]|nr:50S ribosomal protein L9 [Fimbriimonadaceae bacterium]
MKVILNQTVPKVGKEGQVVTVAGGFARNFLFPRGLAVVADRGQMKALEARRARVDAKLAETKAGAETLKEKLHDMAIKIEGKAGRDDTKLFGAITSEKIADAIKEQLGVSVEKKQVGLLEPIKRLGKYSIEIDLHRDVDATVHLTVFDPDAIVEEEVVEEESTAPEEELVEA